MKKIAFFLLFASYMSGTVRAQKNTYPVITSSSASAAGMLPERLQRIDTVINSFVQNKWTNGAVALVIHNGKIAYYKAFGYDDIEAKKLMQKDGIFRIASQTKAITSVAVMMLYEEGKFLLDDPVSKYIPAFKNPQVLDQYNEKDTTYTTIPAKREITIRDLLTHTSGIAYAQIGEGAINAIYQKNGIICGLGLENHILGDDIKKLGRLPLLHQPGEKFTYGLNVDVLGYLVEVLSGMSLDQFFRTRIFEPLGMKDTFFYLPSTRQSRLVNLYLVQTDGVLKKSPGYFEIGENIMRDYPKAKGTYYAGGAGLSSTIMDYAIFLQMLLNGGEYNGKRLLGRNTVRIMTMNQIGDLNLGVNKFGLGFQIITQQGSAQLPVPEGSYSWGGAFSTTYWVDPKEKIIALLYRQLWDDQHERELIDKFKVLVYQAIDQ
ncbi:MAG: serine hydrolase domain-containing protein [Agriterribacter sp.]